MDAERERKRAALHEKLQQLRAVTNSTSTEKESIILDASKYIEDLKQKVERLNEQKAGTSQCTSEALDPLQSSPMVSVETLERGFLINVRVEKKYCSGLLVSILQVFEDLGLDVDVLDSRVSCTDSFQLQAVGKDHNEGHIEEEIDCNTVKQAVLQAIETWCNNNEQD